LNVSRAGDRLVAMAEETGVVRGIRWRLLERRILLVVGVAVLGVIVKSLSMLRAALSMVRLEEDFWMVLSVSWEALAWSRSVRQFSDLLICWCCLCCCRG